MDHKIDISCIILSNLNDSFVKQRIIPSIIENSKSHSIEIIVVDNSSTQDFECNNVKVIHTEPYHIPKAYNKGVSIAKGKYIVNSENIYAVLPQNQTLRPWDNVPRKALAQEISGNRLRGREFAKCLSGPGVSWSCPFGHR